MDEAHELIESIRLDAHSLSRVDLSDIAPQELGQLLRAVERARAAVDAAANSVLDRFDAEGAAGFDGLRSTSSWLRQRCQMTGATAARRVRTTRALRDLPEVAEGFRSGRFSADQADVFARHRSPRTAEAMSQDESALAALADHLTPDDFARELRGWAELVDTDGAEPDPGHRDRGFTFVQTLDDAWMGRLDLSAADGLLVHRAVEAMAEHLHRQQEAGDISTVDGDAPRADDAAGPTGDGTGGTRTPSQRRADALVELVRRGALSASTSAPGSRRGGSPSVTLYLTLDAGDLEAGRGADTLTSQHVGPAGTDHLLCDSAIARVLFDPISGAVLDLGRSRRVVSPKQWSALALRDGGCSFPGCCAPPEETQAHHLVHWRRGGPTNLDNLTLACHHHHSLVHDGGWDVRMATTGPRWSRPDGRAVERRPGWADDPPGSASVSRTPWLRKASTVDPPEVADMVRLARERARALRWAA